MAKQSGTGPLPYYRLWVKDFDTDENVREFNFAELGLFLCCLNHAWTNDGLPENLEVLARIMKARPTEFKKLWLRVGKCFISDSNGRLRNPRQEKERLKALSKSESATSAVRTRYERRSDELPRACARDESEYEYEFEYKNSIPEDSSKIVVFPTSAALDKKTPEDGTNLTDFFEEIFRAHPNKRDRGLAERYLMEIQDIATSRIQVKFRNGHRKWCDSAGWRWKAGARAPTLAQFILDRTWNYDPPVEEQEKSKVQSVIDQALAGVK